jgi:hypothetical protein
MILYPKLNGDDVSNNNFRVFMGDASKMPIGWENIGAA